MYAREQERSKVDDIRGSPMGVATLEEMVDDNHAIISSSVGPEYYVNIMSFVDKDQLEPGASLLTHYKVNSIVGLLADEVLTDRGPERLHVYYTSSTA